MGLKADRYIRSDRIDVYLNEAATRGHIVTKSTLASGVALDNVANLGTLAANPSGTRPLGVLLGDMVDIDVTREFLNTQQDKTVKGGKMRLVTEGWIVTDEIGVGTVTAGEAAYVGASGQFASASMIENWTGGVGVPNPPTEETNATSFPMVGRFDTSKDQNDYARITINIT